MFDNMLNVIITWVAAIVIIVFVVFIIKDIIEIVKGQGSPLRVIGKVLFVFVMLAVIFMCKGYENIGNKLSDVTTNAVGSMTDTAGELFE